MNEQKPPRGIEWTRIHGRRGFTANPIKGCTHECKWRMPDGTIAICYAKDVAERLHVPGYENGFEHLSWHPEELQAIRKCKEPAGIFIDSMSDLFGAKVPDIWILAVLEVIKLCPQHVFFGLTKQPGRLRDRVLPENLWMGISAPPTFMFGHELSPEQQHTWFRRGLDALSSCHAGARWVSLEPLSLDLTNELKEYAGWLDWAVIGAASSRHGDLQPDPDIFKKTVEVLDGIPIFLKGNVNKMFATQTIGKFRTEWPAIKETHDL